MRVVRRRLSEHEQVWRLLMRVRLPEAPPEPQVLLGFKLAQVEDFQPGEEADKPRRTPVDPPRVIEQRVKVDVRDLRGKIGVRARAELSLSRSGGFRAGVWVLTVQSEDGPVGDDVRLTLFGTNGPVGGKPDAGTDAAAPDGGT